MNRKEFLKIASLAGIGSPFYLNGMPSRFMNQFLDFQANCAAVNERVLVILRLAGANDGLNTVIPVSQYDTYAQLRPDIKINNTGANSYIPLDSTVSTARQVGLHPAMTGFKSLYDSGKLALLNGVGYPNPNYSHFRSENLMFAGKDGSSSQDLPSGIFGRYLAALFPGLAGNPTTQSPDPLAIQLGNLNPCLFYEHATEHNIEYNVTGFQQTMFNSLKMQQQVLVPSEYNDLLEYIKQVAVSMDTYYNRVMAVFNAGSNSSATYPATTLGKQLKTVARLIQGGSKTKIFQVNIGGFDTHVNQIVSGASHTGAHASLLADISGSVAAFQADIESLGIANKIMTVTFSEFGRQVKQNANLGTDHGDLAPFFIVGNAVSGGIMGDHPVFTNNTSFYYNQNQRRFDYRQIFASLLQDWLGADTGMIATAELSQFIDNGNKLNLISTSNIAENVCQVLSTGEIATGEFKIYPNPADQMATLDFGTQRFKYIKIEMFDMSGKLVLESAQKGSQTVTEIQTAHLPNGNYLINVVADGEKMSKKLLVKH